MKSLYFVFCLVILLVLSSCSNDSEIPALQCGPPSTDNYIIGQIDSLCAIAETNEDWINLPETVTRFECGRILKSDFINYGENIVYSLLLTIPHIDGNDCNPLSHDAIQVGRYNFLKGNDTSTPGEAGFSVKTGRKIFASWDSDLSQDPEAYIEVTSVVDVDPKPGWSYATYFKRVTGKVNCKIKDQTSIEPPVEVKNLEFSVYMIY